MNYIIIKINQKNSNAVNEETRLRSFALYNNVEVDAVFYDESPQKKELNERAKFLEFLNTLDCDGKIIISSLETLSYRVGELVQIIAIIFKKNFEIVCTNENERLFPSMRADLLLAKLGQKRADNIQRGRSKLGRPQGSRSQSKYDEYLPQIIGFLKNDRNVSALARELGVSRTSLKDYILSRGL